jgi:hypothetical protein
MEKLAIYSSALITFFKSLQREYQSSPAKDRNRNGAKAFRTYGRDLFERPLFKRIETIYNDHAKLASTTNRRLIERYYKFCACRRQTRR